MKLATGSQLGCPFVCMRRALAFLPQERLFVKSRIHAYTSHFPATRETRRLGTSRPKSLEFPPGLLVTFPRRQRWHFSETEGDLDRAVYLYVWGALANFSYFRTLSRYKQNPTIPPKLVAETGCAFLRVRNWLHFRLVVIHSNLLLVSI